MKFARVALRRASAAAGGSGSVMLISGSRRSEPRPMQEEMPMKQPNIGCHHD
jgi:hypothetical protein